jgi:hypothetical protein
MQLLAEGFKQMRTGSEEVVSKLTGRKVAEPILPFTAQNVVISAQTNSADAAACPSCGFFSRDRSDWVRWDGQLR